MLREIFAIYLSCWKRWLDFRGRARRRELAIFCGGNLLIMALMGLAGLAVGMGWSSIIPIIAAMVFWQMLGLLCPYVLILLILFSLPLRVAGTPGDLLILFYFAFQLATLLPLTAVTVRRLHDLDHGAQWLLAGWIPILGIPISLIYFLILLTSEGDRRTNRFGPDPKEPSPNQCPMCLYDLTGNTSGVCPECGMHLGPATIS